MINKCMVPIDFGDIIRAFEGKSNETNKKTKEEVREESWVKLLKYWKWLAENSIIR